MRTAIHIVVSALVVGLLVLPVADARVVAEAPGPVLAATGISVAQRGCMSLSQAIESVRSRGNVERVISAQTRTSGGRETHYIKVLTKDGKVRTHKIPGCGR